jgi:integrase/recombinase XerD
VIKKIFKRPQAIQWNIVDKEIVDEIIFRTMNIRNRLMLELMAKGGMRVGEVLNLAIQKPKSGRAGEMVHVSRKLLVRLTDYIRINKIRLNDRILLILYIADWCMVKKSGNMVDTELCPHDLRRHAAIFASKSGTPFENINKVILRHADLSTAQRYLSKVNDSIAIRWIETFYG